MATWSSASARVAGTSAAAAAASTSTARRAPYSTAPTPEVQSADEPTPTTSEARSSEVGTPSVRALVEAGVLVRPVHVRKRGTNGRRKPTTQRALAAVERAEAQAALDAGKPVAPATPPSPLQNLVTFPDLYRRVRARLWVPSPAEVGAPKDTDMAAWVEGELRKFVDSLSSEPGQRCAFMALSREEQLDFALLQTWNSLDADTQNEAFLRVRFEAARKLGWRRGFSAGFPYLVADKADNEQAAASTDSMATDLRVPKLATEDDEAARKLVHSIVNPTSTSDKLATQRQLLELDEKRAWESWKALSEPARRAEERDAWTNRDRSRVYVDNTPGSSVCLTKHPRWFPEPQRAGPLNFLPNIVIRLVRNYTPPGQQYDVWKATFRVPLSMHKHALRSYLLAIYGLRTTWMRSMIYRTKLMRSARSGGALRPGSMRTYKKVEVGLLEPFLWPGVTADFLSKRMLVHEMQVEAQRAYLKMTRSARWRGRRPADPLHANLTESIQHGIISPDSAEAARTETPRVMTKGGGIPTAKHSRILAILLQKKLDRQAAIRSIVEERAAALPTSSASEAEPSSSAPPAP